MPELIKILMGLGQMRTATQSLTDEEVELIAAELKREVKIKHAAEEDEEPESFDDPDDGFHVGLHEFAHLLDVEQTRFDGVPAGLGAAKSREWLQLVDSEIERLRRGKSVLDAYAAESPVEFLAVAVETFFERPLALRLRHRQVYAILSGYFGQDPAAWDEARGLRP